MPRDDRPPAQEETNKRSLRHELRTPLNQIIGYASMLREEAEDDGLTGFAADAAKIEKAGWRLLKMIDELVLRAPVESSAEDATEVKAKATTEPKFRASEVQTQVVPNPSELTHPPDADVGAWSGARSAAGETPGAVLVVDDSAENRDLLARMLANNGHAVVTADGGEEALDKIRSEPPDIVLLDVMMPDIGGFEVLAEVRKRLGPADLPIIMATACDASQDVVRALRLGANDYVTKPLDMDVVAARVDTQLSLKRARDQIQALNARLDRAQERIAMLADAGESPEGIAEWAGPLAREMTALVGARDVSVWLVEDDRLTCAAGMALRVPTHFELAELPHLGGRQLEKRGGLFALSGLAGGIYGALSISGDGMAWRNREIELLGRFARHLGGALELTHMRRELSRAAERQRETRDQLAARGVELVRICGECGRCYGDAAEICEDDEEVLDATRPLPFRVADRYRLQRVIGEGGMGTVFLAHDERLGRDVATKIIRGRHCQDEEMRLRFENEARTIARIDHPHVVSVFDSGQVPDGSLYIVMELLGGQSLSSLVEADGRGSPHQVAGLLRQGASALEAAHQAGLVHRDIKPDNVFLVPRGGGFDVKILDFGVAKDVRVDTGLTQDGYLLGTPAYMAPEQLREEEVSAASDLYSFALVAYEALTGHMVVRETEMFSVLMEVLGDTPPKPSELLAGVPLEVDQGFHRAMDKEQANRPTDIRAWAEDLATAIEQMPSDVEGWRFG